jgi:hypothetical protein
MADTVNMPLLAKSAPGLLLIEEAPIDLPSELEALEAMDLYQLRVRWRKLTRKAPPEHFPRWLLLCVIAYRLQARVHGDLDPDTASYLKNVSSARLRRLKAGQKGKPKAPPPVPPVPRDPRLKPGTLIGRDYNGSMHRVVVVEGGYAWNGDTYKSLSEIARRITGTRWNGPRFFGLRDKTILARAERP